jgi:hypothetical protein
MNTNNDDQLIDGIGAYVRGLVRQSLDQTNMSETTRSMLVQCLDQMEAAIEGLCPMAMVPTQYGLVRAYGPQGIKKGERVILLATAKNHATFGLPEWASNPEALEEFHTLGRQQGSAILWSYMAEAINETRDISVAAKSFSLRCQVCDECQRIDDECERIWKLELTPIVIGSIGNENGLAGGVAFVNRLPLSFERQLAAAGRH